MCVYLYVRKSADVLELVGGAAVVVHRVEVVEGVDGLAVARGVRHGAGGYGRRPRTRLRAWLCDVPLVQRVRRQILQRKASRS